MCVLNPPQPPITLNLSKSKMVKPSRSRTSLFSQWRFDTTKDHQNNPNSSPSGSTSSDHYSPKDQHHILSPSSTSSTPLPSPSPGLSSDPFRYSLALPAPYIPHGTSPATGLYKHDISAESPYGGLAEEDTDDQHHTYSYNHTVSTSPVALPLQQHHQHHQNENLNRYNQNPDAVRSTESLVSGTATTPKITLASPSTTTIHHYLFPDPDEKAKSNLDPSAARKIAKDRDNSKRSSQAQVGSSTKEEREKTKEEEERLIERKKIESYFPNPPTSRPLGPTKRIVSASSSSLRTIVLQDLDDHDSPVARKDEKHPLSMRTLRRQPSMADLNNNRKKLEVNTTGPGHQSRFQSGRVISENIPGGGLSKQTESWRSTLSTKESEAWRALVGGRDRDLVCHLENVRQEHMLINAVHSRIYS